MITAEKIGLWIGIVAALAAGHARFVSLEEAKENNIRWITELSGEVKTMKEHVDALERDRTTMERVHQIELRLGQLEERLKGRR